jgi:hypothetical protein
VKCTDVCHRIKVTGFHVDSLGFVTNMTIARQRFGKHRLKAGILESEQTSIAEQRFCNHVPAVTNSYERVHLIGNGSASTFP